MELVLVRHGETEWSRSKRHTGRTDVPLTDAGRAQASALRPLLLGRSFALVLTSPLARATETTRLAGLTGAQPDPDLVEWGYGEYEGRTTAEIRGERPGWDIWDEGPLGGESVEAVGERADRVIERVCAADGDVALVAHGHLLRVLAARWIGLPAQGGRWLGLDTATLSVLGFERETRIVRVWNRPAA